MGGTRGMIRRSAGKRQAAIGILDGMMTPYRPAHGAGSRKRAERDEVAEILAPDETTAAPRASWFEVAAGLWARVNGSPRSRAISGASVLVCWR